MATFTRDPATGALTFLEQDVDGASGVDGIAGASSVAVSPDGKNVYVTGNSEAAIATFTRDTGTGALSFLEVDRDTDPGVNGLLSPWGVAVSPNGANVYVASNGDSAISTWQRDPRHRSA